MAITFDEVLLDPEYSNLAEGGPEWATDIQRSGLGGAVSVRNINREDFISKYEISYEEMGFAKLTELRNFGILRRGQARGFRFLAPDDSYLASEKVGKYNSTTGEIEQVVTTDGSTTRFFVIKTYEDDFDSYLRWIGKPSSLHDFTIEIFNGATLLETVTIAANSELSQGETVSLGAFGNVSVYFNYGMLEFAVAPSAGKTIKITGRYHLPAVFTTDISKYRVDESAISDFQIGIEELLWADLGMTPAMAIVLDDTTPPTTPGTPVVNSQSFDEVTIDFAASTDDVGVTGYQYRLDGGAWLNFPSFSGTSTITATVSGLTLLTAYEIEVRAFDLANNYSGASGILTVTTDDFTIDGGDADDIFDGLFNGGGA